MAANASILGAVIGAADFYFGDSYTGETYSEPTNLVDVGLTSGGTRIIFEPETIAFKSEQLRGHYGGAYQNKVYRVQVGGLDQNTIWNIANAWALASSDVMSSSVITIDHQDLTERGVKFAVQTTKINAGGSAGTRNYLLGRVAQWGSVELNYTVEDITRMGIELMCFLDKNGVFGEVTQTVGETAPS